MSCPCQLRPSVRLTILALRLIALAACLLPAAAREALPTFAEWRTACDRLPLNRALGMRLPAKEQLPLQSFSELERLIDAFFALSTNGPLGTATNWVGGSAKRETFLNVEKNWFVSGEIPFEPFAEKLVLPPSARVIHQGDLHGDIRSLLAIIGQWNTKKWFDGFQVVDPDLHVVFHGDYTDRGMYGVEVLYTLFRLKLANPDRVHLVRGNHEDVSLVSRYGFLAEARAKFGREFNPVKLLRAYDFLPVVLYVGSGADYIQLCHGGLEPGYSPVMLLTSPGTNRFQFLGALNQSAYLQSHPGFLGGEAGSQSDARRYFRDFTPSSPTAPSVLGFMWNDFTVFANEPAFANNPDRAFVYGKPAVEGFLKSVSPDGARVHAIFRAHQHSGISNPIMRRLVASRGIFRHWQENQSAAAESAEPAVLAPKLETGESRPIPEGSVWTLNVVPDSVYGAGCNFSFATYGVLKLGAGFDTWRLGVETVVVPGL